MRREPLDRWNSDPRLLALVVGEDCHRLSVVLFRSLPATRISPALTRTSWFLGRSRFLYVVG